MMRRREPHGFTLVELLIALALTGIVSLLMLEGVRFSALGLGRLSDQAERLEARRSVEELLRRELGAAFAAPLLSSAPPLTGGPQSLQFLTLAEDSGAGLYRVALGVEAQGVKRRLVLSRRRVDAGGAVDAERTVLAPRLDSVQIAYFGAPSPGDEAHWQDRWEGMRDPPALVRIEFDAGDGLRRPPLVVRLWAATR